MHKKVNISQILSGDSENHIALAIVVAAGVFLAVTLLWQVFDSLKIAGVFDKTASKMGQSVVTSDISKDDEYSKWPIFGKSEPVKERVNTKYTLLGILLADDNKHSKAIIMQPGQEAQVYMLGDKVNGFVVHAIDAEKVVLRGHDALESLYILWEGEETKIKNPIKGTGMPVTSTANSPASGTQSKPKTDYKEIREKYLQRIKDLRGKSGGTLQRYRGYEGAYQGGFGGFGGFNTKQVQEKIQELRESGKIPAGTKIPNQFLRGMGR